MKVTLNYFLERQKKDLKHFIIRNKIKCYNDLLIACKIKLLIPCEEKEFDIAFLEIYPPKKTIKSKVAKRRKSTSKKKDENKKK